MITYHFTKVLGSQIITLSIESLILSFLFYSHYYVFWVVGVGGGRAGGDPLVQYTKAC